MKLSRQDVEHVAELAKLSLTEAEKTTYQAQLSAILDYFEMLQQIDTEAISPTASVLALQNVMREDEVRPSFPREQIITNAPEHEDGQFRVEAILD
ncbi:MAG: Asp-tRNA(Asn)/Glu-tRNA(Gln) amidotransferase subunit GatC [Anaerolineae bacterium]|nr:Asp-tRNA(Asn)/Glu-tRNA(Gln) amidotransferase subunit GatC [Anaerolineae bacterium]